MNVRRSQADELRAGVAELRLDLPEQAIERLLDFGELLLKWNRIYNLTSIRNPREIVTLHLLDSLTLLPYVRDYASIADIGSGAGLPGIPLCIARSDLEVHSVEAVNKKVSFQRQAKIELSLSRFFPENLRVEDFLPQVRFEAVVSRAFSSLADFVRSSGHLLKPGGALLAMKGRLPEAEMAELPDGWRVASASPLEVPGLDAARYVVEIRHA